MKFVTCLVKNNNNESVQTVSDEDTRKECDFCNTICQCIGFGRQVLKRCVRGQQNPTLHVVREGKYEKMTLFPAVN